MTSDSKLLSSNETISPKHEDKNFETYSLVWLDESINSPENIDAQNTIRSTINYLEKFDQLNQCEDYIQSVSSEHRIILIVSGHFGQQLIPQIHHLPQVFSIYIYCRDTEFHQQWSQQYNKVRGVHNQFDDLINQVRSDQSRRRQNRSDEPFGILTFNSDNNDEKSTMDLNGRFLQYQLLISCLLKMQTTSKDKTEFIAKCREFYEGNAQELKNVDEFEKDYEAEHSLWWYTGEKFLYRLLNKALRVQDIDLLFQIRFFIRDIEKELHRYRCSSKVHVYRGQRMSCDELNILKNSQNQYISITSFLSTSKNIKVARMYIDNPLRDLTSERVLFEIEADADQVGVKPFADVSRISQFTEEDEILMMAGSVFRVENISYDEQKFWNIKMLLCGETDFALQTTFHQMSSQYSAGNSRILLFANVLIDMAHFDAAQKYLSRLLEQLPSDHKDIFKCYQALGKVLCEKGDYESSRDSLNKALKFLETCRWDDSRKAYIYNNIGEVYQNEKKYQQALEYYQKALEIFEEHFNDEDQNIGWCYNNLGTIYEKLKNYSQARECLLRALEIKLKSLPARHPCLSNTYNNIGNVHYGLKEYDEALRNYELSYDIFQKSLNAHHPSIARVLKNIGHVYEAQGKFPQAKETYEKVLQKRERILSSSHPDITESKGDIERVLSKIK